METNYARRKNMGKHYTFNAFVSQYLLYPRKRKFAKRQLVGLYKLTNKTKKDTFFYIGSYAGAVGWAQFIPTSALAYFVDANGIDSDIDLYSIEDCIFSIENYLYKHKLNGKTMKNYKNRYDAVFAYNRHSAYVRAVLYMYEEFKKWTPLVSL